MLNESSSSSPVVLATNQLGWTIFQQPDGYLQLDFGRNALLLTPNQLASLQELVQTAARLDLSSDDGELAKAGPQRAVYYCSHHQLYLMTFDHKILRFRPTEFEALSQLCGVVKLQPQISALPETVDYLKTIRPAHGLN
jgi:hypothetical protein